ncbi:MAG: helix-turn-helix domain-containing protein [Desulfuromonadales bacterium]|nr:helix-turn-helix domain-containing protein [Desulfuromonadales bacterium]
MKPQDPKEIFGRRLSQARRMRGMSLRAVAEAIGGKVSYNALHRYERGEMMPGDEVLISVADVLDKPLDFFFRPFTVELSELRFRKTTGLGAKSEDAVKELATDFFERYCEIEQILGLHSCFRDPLSRVKYTRPEEAEEAADKVRAHWKLGENPLPNVTETLEINGFKIFEVEAPESFDGFSGWADCHPVIVLAKWLNNDIPRKRFTALHEAAHLLVAPHTDLDGKELESFCNHFAGALLIPAEVFTADFGGFRHRISLEELIDLKRRYGMSIAAIMHRAHDLKLIDDSTNRQFWIIRRKKGWDRVEPGEYLGAEHSSRFEQLVLRATAEEQISFDKGASLLNVPLVDFRQTLSEFL